jgi:hypothetical protein
MFIIERRNDFRVKVYFKQNFWDTREGILGVPQKVDWKFTYENQQYYIPMIYRFQEGITIDIISLLDTAKIKEFHEKYESRVNSMSEEELQYLETINPIQEFPLRKIYINNELAQSKGSCTSCHIAGMDRREKDNALTEIQRENIFLQGEDISFQCMRVHIKYLTECQRNVHSMKFITSKTEYLIPVRKHFKIDIDTCEKEYEEVFVHPLSGVRHHVYINEIERKNARELFPQYELNNPFNFAIVSYELKPSLHQDERLLLTEKKQPDESMTDDNKSATSIGVIFGNKEIKLGKHGYPLESFSTKMYWKSLKNIEINIAGIYKKKCSEEEILVFSS